MRQASTQEEWERPAACTRLRWPGVAVHRRAAVDVILALVITLSVLGILRLPHVLLRLHAAGQAVLPGVAAILLATLGTGEARLVSRALRVCVFLLITAPVSAQVIARVAWQEEDGSRAEGETAPERPRTRDASAVSLGGNPPGQSPSGCLLSRAGLSGGPHRPQSLT